MVTIRKSRVSDVEEVYAEERSARKARRKAFLKRTAGQVYDEETQQFVAQDEYTEESDA